MYRERVREDRGGTSMAFVNSGLNPTIDVRQAIDVYRCKRNLTEKAMSYQLARAGRGLREYITVAGEMGAEVSRSATGAAFVHPVPAGISVACDVVEAVLQQLPHAHWHSVVALVLHIISDILTAQPY